MPRRAPLHHLLSGLTPADPLEQEHQAAMLALCADPTADPFDRARWAPGHFTASAFVLSPDEDELLLIFHEKLQRWLQPGGHIEPSDADVIAAALREVAEETAVVGAHPLGSGLFDVDVHTIPGRKADPPHRHFDARILLRAPSRAMAAGSDALSARWVRLDEVPLVETDESVMRAVRKLRARLGEPRG